MSENNSQFVLDKKTLAISYLAYFFQYGVAILVLPMILSKLSSDDIAIWYIFLSIFSLVSLLDFGFSSSLQRSISYVFSGSSILLKDGFEETKNNELNYSLLSSLIYTSKHIYKNIAKAIFILSITLGSLYLYFTLDEKFDLNFFLIWLLYSISISIYFFYSYILSLLKGRGFVNQFNIVIIISKSIYVIVLTTLVFCNFGLLSLVLANLANTIVMIFLGEKFFFQKKIRKRLMSVSTKPDNLFSILWKNAQNSGIVSVGVFMLSQSGIFLSGVFLSLEEVAQLGITLQLFSIIVVLSRVYLTTSIPHFSSLWIEGKKYKIKSLFLRCQIVGYAIFFISVITLLFMGNYILNELIHSNILLPSSIVIILYAIFNLMEITHGNCCSIIATANVIPFTKSSIIAGITSIVCTIIFIKLGLGIISFPLALICGSLPYNSWKWPLETFRLLRK